MNSGSSKSSGGQTSSSASLSSDDIEQQQQQQGVEIADVADLIKDRSSAQQAEGSSCWSRIKCLMVALMVVVGVTVGLSLALTGKANPAAYFMPPVDPPGKAEANRWDATAGLTLIVENACTEDWTPFFDQSLKDWNATEAVNLIPRRVAVDPECQPTTGRLKVCNADYGDTAWHGINYILQNRRTELIAHSVSKLNDRFMKNDDDRTYIMCHENGHGLGLPHTDEDHFNRDRGDCMDYTRRPRNNRLPGQFNLDLLELLYGTPSNPLNVTANGLPSYSNQDLVPPLDQRPPGYDQDPNEKDDKKKKKKDEEEDDRRSLLSLVNNQQPQVDFSDWHALELAAAEACDQPHCSFAVADDYVLHVSQFMRPGK